VKRIAALIMAAGIGLGGVAVAAPASAASNDTVHATAHVSAASINTPLGSCVTWMGSNTFGVKCAPSLAPRPAHAVARPAASGGAYQVIASPCLWSHQWREPDYPSTSLPRIRCWGYGSWVHVGCWRPGQSINGDSYWLQLIEDSNNNYAAIAADYYINTGSNNPNTVGIPVCQG
jgi:hypothetical protein